jgi:hypothetical protein
MKHVRIPQKQTDTDYIKFIGGLDLLTPVMSLKAGNALDAVNYEPGVKGGFRRIDGYERFDGRPSPSAATYVYLEANITGMILAGYVVTGATSGATGTVIRVGAGELAVTKVTGTFLDNEALNYGGGPVATLTMPPIPRGYRTAYDDAVALAAAADLYRADIQAVPGSGSVRGAWMYKGVVYAFRDNAGATACEMYKGTATGWQKVTLFHETSFTTTAPQTYEIKDGDTIVGVTSGATALVKRVMKQSGEWASSNVKGRLILTNITGTFQAEVIKVGANNCGNLAGAPTQITLLPGGRYECLNYNFTGNTATFRMYGCDGKNRAFEFDGETYAPIATGMTQDAPKFIALHKRKLWLAFMGSLQNSGEGLPYNWTVVTGANEMGIGDDIVGMKVQPGDTLAVFSRNSAWQVNGTTTSSFQLLPISTEVGAIPYTVQSLGKTYAMDDRGIVETIRVQNYGNFDQSTVSTEIQPIIDSIRAKVIGSATYNNRNQYRIYCNDGAGIIMTVSGEHIVGFTQLLYPVPLSCISSCEDATGKSVVFMGSTNGYVYQADRGSSFDGAEIESYLRMPFSSLQSPRFRKQFKKAVLEMTAVGYSAIRFQPEFSYGDPDVATHRLQTGEVTGAGGSWDVSNWEEFFYDARLVSSPEFGIEGTGLNMALLFYSKSKLDLGHTLQGMIVHNSLRRLAR